MEALADVVFLSRVQFALTAMFHFIFVPLSIGIGLIFAISETRAYRSGDERDKAASWFWAKVFTATFAVGVATGITMEFSFGTNWADYSRFVGDIFGAPLAAEALFAFFLESTFHTVRAQSRREKVLPGIELAGSGRQLPVGAVDSDCEFMDADAGWRGSFRGRKPCRAHRLRGGCVQPEHGCALFPHSARAYRDGRVCRHCDFCLVYAQRQASLLRGSHAAHRDCDCIDRYLRAACVGALHRC